MPWFRFKPACRSKKRLERDLLVAVAEYPNPSFYPLLLPHNGGCYAQGIDHHAFIWVHSGMHNIQKVTKKVGSGLEPETFRTTSRCSVLVGTMFKAFI